MNEGNIRFKLEAVQAKTFLQTLTFTTFSNYRISTVLNTVAIVMIWAEYNTLLISIFA